MRAYLLLVIIFFSSISLFSQTVDHPESGEILNDIDGNMYKTTAIGNQVWMAENLRVTKYNDGSAIPLYTESKEWRKKREGGYCWYKNDSAAYASEYGALYNYPAVETEKLCPSGWHVPDNTEWRYIIFINLNSVYYNLHSISLHTIKFDYNHEPEKLCKVFPQYYIDSLVKNTLMFNKIFDEYLKVLYNPFKLAPKFKLQNEKYWGFSVSPVSSETYHTIDAPNFVFVTDFISKEDVNETKFSALPGGCRNILFGKCREMGSAGYWWSRSGGCFYMSDDLWTCSYIFNGIVLGSSVRCVKD